MSAINPPQAVALRDIRTDDVVTIESGDDELGSTITGRVHGVDTCKTAILLGDQIWYSLADGSDWRYVAGYRPAPEVEPGTVGTATVRGVEGVRIVRTDRSPESDLTGVWFTPLEEQIGGWWHPESEVTSFVPDPDTAALRAEVERLNGELEAERHAVETQSGLYEGLAKWAKEQRARAAAAEARLAGACAAIAGQITSWEAENSERWAEVHTSVKVAIDAAQYAVVENLRDLLALVAADEQAAEGEGKYGSGDLPFGLTVSDDGGLINWRGDNYVRQGVALAALPTRDEIADAMHDDRLPDGEPRLGRAYRLILADAVLTLLKRGAS